MSLELTAFRMIIDREVQRVGTSKKRKGVAETSSAKKVKSFKSPIVLSCLNLADNFLVLENITDSPIAMEKWTVSNMTDKSFTFPMKYILKPNSQVKIGYAKSKRKGKTTNDSEMDFLGSKKYLWNAKGDIATLKNANGDIIAQVSKGDAPPLEMEEAVDDILNTLYEEHQNAAIPENTCSIM